MRTTISCIYCDKCGKKIDVVTNGLYQNVKSEHIYFGDSSYEICKSCFDNFKKWFSKEE